MPQPLDDALLVEIEAHAVDMAREASAILGRHFGNSLDVEYKDKEETDPVTNADKETQDFLEKAILEKFPEHSVLGEEDEDKEQEESLAPDIVWVLDPLDGTKNFVGGLPMYACSIGVIHRGVPIAGAVFIPWPGKDGGTVLRARKDGGAFIDDKLITVLKSDEPKGNALVTLPAGFGAMFRLEKPMHGKVGDVRMAGSIAYELAMVACGVTQYMVTTGPRLWDVAGGAMLVIEAGGLILRGSRESSLMGFSTATRWETVESLVPTWQSGKTTMKELRQWSAVLVLGGPGVVRYVTSNMATRQYRWRRFTRAVRRLKPRRQGKEEG